MKDRTIAAVILSLLWGPFLLGVASWACSGAGWSKGGELAVDVATCTLDRLIEEERRKGHGDLAARLELVSLSYVEPDGGARR